MQGNFLTCNFGKHLGVRHLEHRSREGQAVIVYRYAIINTPAISRILSLKIQISEVPMSGKPLSQLPAEMPAYQFRILDSELQAYLQTYPFMDGSDLKKSTKARKAVLENFLVRSAGINTEVSLLMPDQTNLASEERMRAEEMLVALGVDASRQHFLFNDFEWKASRVPRSAKNVLVIGCGDGMELIFLRAVLPGAKITAMDYNDKLSPQLKEMVRPIFLQGDISRILDTLAAEYDLVSSNHTLEHLFTPDETIQKLYRLLVAGGSLMAGMPMDGKPGTPFWAKWQGFARQKKFIRWI
jgi:hypothetical protein